MIALLLVVYPVLSGVVIMWLNLFGCRSLVKRGAMVWLNSFPPE